MENRALWNLMVKVWDQIKIEYRSDIELVADELGLKLHEWGLLLAVLKYEPDLTTTAHLMVRDPFTAAEVFRDRLLNLAARGFLIEASPGKFQFSIRGREATHQLINSAREAMQEGSTLPGSQLEDLSSGLEKLVYASLNASSPPNKWSIKLSYKLMPAPNPPLPFIEQAFTCLAAYREDAYLAAWRKCGLSATALEVLTLFWNSEVNSFDTLCDYLAYRGHSCEVYTDIVHDLRRQGLLDSSENELWITASGRMFRNGVQEATEEFFFAPWDILSGDEKEKMSQILLHFSPVTAQ